MIRKFGRMVSERLAQLGFDLDRSIVVSLCEKVHTASLITEEGKFVQGSVTLADPLDPDDFPRLRRADYPSFTTLGEELNLTPENFAKLARAVDKWSGSIAVWGYGPKKIVAWGIVDQLVGTNTRLNREADVGFHNPGILTLAIDRPGDLTAYHGNIFLGSLRAQKMILKESEPFEDSMVLDKIKAAYAPFSKSIANAISEKIESEFDEDAVSHSLHSSWAASVSRICIGLQRLGTGGAMIFSSEPLLQFLSIGRKFSYERLSNSLIFEVLDGFYFYSLENVRGEAKRLNIDFVNEMSFAQADFEDRKDELRGAVKLVTSLAAMDGAVLLTPDFQVLGFGVKISAIENPISIYDGEDFAKKGRRAKKISTSNFGTRHGSMFRYCFADPHAIGVVISQDGHVRVITTFDGCLVMWDGVQLLHHSNFTPSQVAQIKDRRKRLGRRKSSENLGYSEMPKTRTDLLEY